ncbi:TIR domain-containing protein [Spirabiliibacterium falconis]|uniref:TIR domain-containing protein n=1 Tax=Spirabiliibacterium falconis TaxID=572023 RepID=UPI001F40B687|nr:TIR domain-containing protein [Spirabiliibacterium falconis]
MRRVFFSFHYENDNWRVQTIKNIGVVNNQIPVYSNEWEKVRLKRDNEIKKWIDENIKGCSCLVVLIGEETASRKWVLYEIEQAWNNGKGVLGIYIHNLEDKNGNTSVRGSNPFESFELSQNLLSLNIPVHCYNPLIYTGTLTNEKKKVSQRWYEQIKENLVGWVEEAIKYRNTYNYMITRR